MIGPDRAAADRMKAPPTAVSQAGQAATAEGRKVHQLCSQSNLGMHDAEFQAFVADRLPSIGGTVAETRR